MADNVDVSSRVGAAWLAMKIDAYWRAKGYRGVTVFTERAVAEARDGDSVYAVRSNLVNGLPPR